MVTENGIQSDGNTSFLRAARAGNLEKVLEHLKNNVDINTSNANGLNALHLAAKDGHEHVVAELLSRGAIVDNATKKGNTALHIASLAGQENVVKLLLQHNASVNAQSQNGFTPLYMAAQENHDSVVKLLLANGANQSLATEDGFTPLAVAMQQGHDKVVAVLLESDTRGKVRLPALHIAAKKDDVKAATLLLENEHNPDVTSKSGFTPLHIASHYGNEAIANLLIQKGADVNFAAKHNISPLHVTAKWGKTNMVSLLLEKGANIESKTRDGLTPLHCAARSGHEQVVDMLLERGAPISAKTKNGLAPLHMAAQGEHVDAARILLYHRAPVDEVTVDYLTALHVAAHCGHVRVAKLLLDRNADANARALNGFTPLHIACKKNRIKVVELLLKHGASISATTESGLTPLHVASFMGCMNIVIYLLQHEASPDVPTVRGETPLHLAARANQTDIIRILLRNGAQVDARAREQQTPLHIASRLGNVDIVMLLLQHGAQVDATTKDMYTALHIAAKEGQDEVAGVLIENGASLDATTKKGFTPLHLAAKYGHIKVGELLLQKNASVDAQGKNGVTPLHVASHYDHQSVALLLLNKGASPHSTAKNGHTPLHIAARKNQMDIATTLLEYGAQANCESKAGFTPLHLSAQEGHTEMSSLLLEHKADANHQARNGLTPMHLCAQEDKVNVAQILVKHGADIDAITKAGYTPLHVACHFGQANMVRFLHQNGASVNASTNIDYTPLHQAAQQGHCHIVNLLIENKADPNALTANGQTPLNIASKLGYISVLESLKNITNQSTSPMQTSMTEGEKYRVVAPEAMHETFMSDSEEEGGDDNTTDQPYRYLTVDEMKSLGDDSLPIDVTRDERIDSNRMVQSTESAPKPPTALEDAISPQHASIVGADKSVVDSNYIIDNIKIDKSQQHVGKLHWRNFLVSFLVDARGGAMRGCRHSGIRIIVPARSAAQPTRITCRYVKPQRTLHPPQLMEGEALASRVLELGPVGAKFLGPVVMEVPHFASLRGKEREIVILRSDNGETWREHTVDNSEEIIQDILNDCFEPEDLNQMDDLAGGRLCRFVTYDFPQYFAVVSRIRQEVHAIGPEGGMVSSTVVPQVQAVFPQGALTKKIKVGLQAQPIDPDLTAKLLGRGVAVSPIVTVEPRRRKFHKAITLSMPAPKPHSQGMINQYSGNAPTLRLLCSITGGPSRAQWEDVTGSTPLTFVNDCVSFTTTVSARFWLMDCRNITEATKMATDLYREAIHVPFMAKFVVFAKRIDPMEARLRVFCMTDDKEDKTLECQESFTEVAKSRDVEVLEGKPQYTELAGNLIPVTKSGEQLQIPFKAFRENRLPFNVRVKDQHADTVGRALFMREPRVAKGEQPQQPICILNIVLPEKILPDHIQMVGDNRDVVTRINISRLHKQPSDEYNYLGDLRIVDISNLLGEDWIRLAPEIGVSQAEISTIKEQHPNSTAQQAQSMLSIYQVRRQNARNILEHGLRAIKRGDIIAKCMKITNYIETSKQETASIERRKNVSLDNGYEEPDIMKDSESVEELVFQEDNRLQQLREREELKYSAEEKIVEDSESEDDDVKRSVAERREQIQKRLSIERQIPASTQKREIVQEITEIKRHSLIEDKKALHEEEIIMRAPTDNIIKSSAIPEPIIKLKSTRKDGGPDISKTEFDKELQDKFKTTIKGIDEFEHKIFEQTAPIVKQEAPDLTIDTKIEYDSTVTEKPFKDLDDEKMFAPIAAPRKTETISRTSEDIRICTSDNKLLQDTTTIRKKEDTITTIRFIEQEVGESQKLLKKTLSKESSQDSIDPQLAAKLSAQKDKIVEHVEQEPDIVSPVKCEIKKTISSDLIDAELSSKLSKQKEKADRILEDDPVPSKIPVSTVVYDSKDSALGKDQQIQRAKVVESKTEKLQSVDAAPDRTSQIPNDTQKLIGDHVDINKMISTKDFLKTEQVEAHKLHQEIKQTVTTYKTETVENLIDRKEDQVKDVEAITTKSAGQPLDHIAFTKDLLKEEQVEADKLILPKDKKPTQTAAPDTKTEKVLPGKIPVPTRDLLKDDKSKHQIPHDTHDKSSKDDKPTKDDKPCKDEKRSKIPIPVEESHKKVISSTIQFLREESIEADKLHQEIIKKDLKTEIAEKKIDPTPEVVISHPDSILLPDKIKSEPIALTHQFLHDEISEAHKLAQQLEKQPVTGDDRKKTGTGPDDMKTAVKHSTELFKSEIESDEFYKSIEEKITKKLSQESSVLKEDFNSVVSHEIKVSQTPPPTPNEYQQQQQQELINQDEETTENTEQQILDGVNEDTDGTKVPGGLNVLPSSDTSTPKPSPRLTKPTSSAMPESSARDPTLTSEETPLTYSRQVTQIAAELTEDQFSDDHVNDQSKIDAKQESQEENAQHSQTAHQPPPVPRPRSQLITNLMHSEESIETSSVKDISHSSSKISSEQQVEYSESSDQISDIKHEFKDDDSILVEDRLEDESFPISDRLDSDHVDIKIKIQKYSYSKDDSLEIDSIRDKDEFLVDLTTTKKDDFSIYKTKEREDILDSDEPILVSGKQISEDLDDNIEELESDEPTNQASFYIGESSTNIITKSSTHIITEEDSQHKTDIQPSETFDDFIKPDKKPSSIESKDKTDEFRKVEFHPSTEMPYVSAIEKEKSLESAVSSITTTTVSHITSYHKEDLQLDLRDDSELTENFSKFCSTSDALYEHQSVSPSRQRATVVHSPVKPFRSAIEIEKSMTIKDDAVIASKAQITNVRTAQQSDSDKLKGSFIDMQNAPSAYDQSLVEQTFAEMQESLEAIQEGLIDVVKDGRQIKESPSEFEFKLLPNIKYPVLESHEEESMHLQHASPEKAKIKTTIEVKEPQPAERTTSPKPQEEEGSSNEDSINKLDVIHRKTKDAKKGVSTNRWSVSDPDNYSSSGSHYESFEKTDSRPCSSDVENLLTFGNSSEYQTAHDASMVPGSTEYHTAASILDHSGKTISSRESMKSLDSESSGHLGSIEISEASETLVPSTVDLELQSDLDENELKMSSLDTCSGVLLEELDDEQEGRFSPNMKRSQEMTFKQFQESTKEDFDAAEEKKLSEDIEEYKYGSMDDSKLGTSLEDGSVLSMSLSSTSNIVTIVDNQKDDMASSFGSSLIGSLEMHSMLRDDITGFEDQSLNEQSEAVTATTTPVQREEDDVSSRISAEQKTETIETENQTKRTKGHKRTDSTTFLRGLDGAKPIVEISLDEEMIIHDEIPSSTLIDDDDKRGSGSDSDYDRYETEYSRSFKQPTQQNKKSKGERKIEKAEVAVEIPERKISLPSIETIVEDVVAEIESELTQTRALSQNMLDYSNVPDITITDDLTKFSDDADDFDVAQEVIIEQAAPTRELPSPIQYAKQSEIQITEEEYQELIDKQYSVKMSEKTTRYDEYDDDKADSPTSDSFEMIEQPDIADEFVIVEEVAKEAGEFDSEGKSVRIKQIKYEKKHDDEVETLLVKSAPAATNEGSIIYQARNDMAFEFEESPPIDSDSNGAHTYDTNGLDSSKKWVEMQLAEQAQNLRYPYDMERGVLEDIKEEDTDFEVGSSRISSFKDSFSSTPDYDMLAARKYMAREHDDMSVNSLQEFENLEHAISLENRKFHQGSQDSSSNGSFSKRYLARSGGDDISLSSLKEFEGLENACIEAQLIEIKAKEEAALLLSRSDESNNSDKGSKSTMSSSTVTTKTITRTIKGDSPPKKVIEERITTSSMDMPFKSIDAVFKLKSDDLDDDGSSKIMEVSTDSLDFAARQMKPSQSKDTSHYGSTDSLEINRSSNDIMTSSIDSIEISKEGGLSKSGKSSKSDVDSLEQLLLAARADEGSLDRRDSIDSIELQYALMAQAASYDRDSIDGTTQIDVHTTVSTSGGRTIQTRTITTTSSAITDASMTKDISSDSLNVNEPELLLTSTESLDRSSSVTTNATYHESEMSGSMTSCGSNTLVDPLDGQSCSSSDILFTVASSPNLGAEDRQGRTSGFVYKSQSRDGEQTFEQYEMFDSSFDTSNKKGGDAFDDKPTKE